MNQTRHVKITLQLSEKCNLRCTYCYLPEKLKSKDIDEEKYIMDSLDAIDKQFKDSNCVLDQISPHGAETFVIKPKILSRIMNKISGMQRLPYAFIQTNGTLLSKEYHEEFGDHTKSVIIGFSIDAKPVHDKYRNNTYDRVWTNLLYTRSLGYSVKILSVITKETLNHLDELTKLIKAVDDLKIPISFMFVHGGGELDHDDQIKLGMWGLETGYWNKIQGMSSFYCLNGKCKSSASLHFNLDGTVSSCNSNNNPNGYIANWRTDPMDELITVRDTAFDDVPISEECLTCNIKELCHSGCPIMRDPGGHAIDCVFKRYVWGKLYNMGESLQDLYVGHNNFLGINKVDTDDTSK